MKGFQKLSQHLHSDIGVGSLRIGYQMRSRTSLDLDCLLNGTDFEVLILKFAQVTLYLLAKGTDDQIEILFDPPYDLSQWQKISLKQKSPWTDFWGMDLLRVWSLQNDDGCFDALQLAFISTGTQKYAILQIEVIASQFYISVLEKIKL